MSPEIIFVTVVSFVGGAVVGALGFLAFMLHKIGRR